LKKGTELDAKLQAVDNSVKPNPPAMKLSEKTFKRDDVIDYEAFKESRENLIRAVEKTFKDKNEVVQIRGPANTQTKASLHDKSYKDTDKIRRPPSNESSRYIKYDLTEFWKTIQANYP